MKKSILLFVVGLFSILFFTCNDNAAVRPVEYSHQFVIGWYNDTDSSDLDWFKVIDIQSHAYQAVPAIMELEGKYYLSIMSRFPSFQNKVFEGEFFIDQPIGSPKPDTVFRVTKHLRDTLLTR
jgi:hypothetical protein